MAMLRLLFKKNSVIMGNSKNFVDLECEISRVLPLDASNTLRDFQICNSVILKIINKMC